MGIEAHRWFDEEAKKRVLGFIEIDPVVINNNLEGLIKIIEKHLKEEGKKDIEVLPLYGGYTSAYNRYELVLAKKEMKNESKKIK